MSHCTGIDHTLPRTRYSSSSGEPPPSEYRQLHKTFVNTWRSSEWVLETTPHPHPRTKWFLAVLCLTWLFEKWNCILNYWIFQALKLTLPDIDTQSAMALTHKCGWVDLYVDEWIRLSTLRVPLDPQQKVCYTDQKRRKTKSFFHLCRLFERGHRTRSKIENDFDENKVQFPWK